MANHLLRLIIALLTIALVALAASVRLATPSAAFVSEDVVINEFRTNGPDGADDEFIELANISDSVVNLDGWRLTSLTGLTESTRIPVPSMSLPPGAHVLLTGPKYSGVVRGDWLYSQGITDNCSIRLWNAAGRLVDAVSTEVGFLGEGGRLPTVDRDDDWSYERVRDTDDNDQDFRLISPSNTQRKGGAAVRDRQRDARGREPWRSLASHHQSDIAASTQYRPLRILSSRFSRRQRRTIAI